MILFTPDGRLSVSFNGDPAQAGFESIEMLEFRERENKKKDFVVLRHMEFQEDVKRRARYFNEAIAAATRNPNLNTLVPGRNTKWSDLSPKGREEMILALQNEVSKLSGDPLKQGENPPACVSCHRKDARWNWDSYATWKGFTGETGDLEEDENAERFMDFLGKDSGKPRDPEAYRACISRIRKAIVSNPRYQSIKELMLENLYDAPAVNRTYTQRIYELNFIRISRLFDEKPNGQLARKILLWGINGCSYKVYRQSQTFIQRMDSVLRPLGFNVYDLLTTVDENPAASFHVPSNMTLQMNYYLTLGRREFDSIFDSAEDLNPKLVGAGRHRRAPMSTACVSLETAINRGYPKASLHRWQDAKKANTVTDGKR